MDMFIYISLTTKEQLIIDKCYDAVVGYCLTCYISVYICIFIRGIYSLNHRTTIEKFRKVSKPKNCVLRWPYRSEIWQYIFQIGRIILNSYLAASRLREI